MLSIHLRNIDFVSARKLAYAVSATIILIALLSLAIKGLNLGLDFTGGTQVEMSFAEAAETSEVRAVLDRAGLERATIQYFGSKRGVLVRLPVTEHVDPLQIKADIIKAFVDAGDAVPDIRRVESIGAQVGSELLERGWMAVMIALGGIALYIWMRFERRFAIGALLATAHDPLLILGYFSLTGTDFDLTVLAAILAVVGYSVNDTVVVFDRIRENFRRMRKATPVEVVNSAVNQTMSRSLITSGTTLMTVVAMFFFGGPMLHGFSLALIIGILVGTYSSIFVASTVALDLGVSRRNLLPIDKETGKPVDDTP
ncbi:protein translocase subunit SecF [Thiocystis violacea]|uniref:protein translocase subunit SecF n=1 Tax=Thiocystis violacea TaxID=13725 RepID=UPI0019083A6E|nr:protein translocase subunit SecF [Thiocystis violacea]MBK1721512.1 protein translocase subunit SecF [Thiocystis violacea]